MYIQLAKQQTQEAKRLRPSQVAKYCFAISALKSTTPLNNGRFRRTIRTILSLSRGVSPDTSKYPLPESGRESVRERAGESGKCGQPLTKLVEDGEMRG